MRKPKEDAACFCRLPNKCSTIESKQQTIRCLLVNTVGVVVREECAAGTVQFIVTGHGAGRAGSVRPAPRGGGSRTKTHTAGQLLQKRGNRLGDGFPKHGPPHVPSATRRSRAPHARLLCFVSTQDFVNSGEKGRYCYWSVVGTCPRFPFFLYICKRRLCVQ